MNIVSYEFCDMGYKKIMSYGEWRVAILKYCEELEIQNIKSFQKHCNTDEVFILLEGDCVLFEAGKHEQLEAINAIPMEKNRAYNVKKGVWHTHTLSKNTTVIIIENEDTSDENSPMIFLNHEKREELYTRYEALLHKKES